LLDEVSMLSLALIVKNEEKNLARCLDSVQGLWDELVIVDTGSTDKTVEIAKRYTKNVHYFEWIDHFSKARNYSFSKCTQPWIMWLDADDILKPEDIKKIRKEFETLSQRPDIDYILINYHYYVEPPTDQGIPQATQLRERIVRRSVANWVGRCHEHMPVNFSRSTVIEDAFVWHMRDNEDRIADSDRNINLMKLAVKEEPNARNHFYLGDAYSDRGKSEKAVVEYEKSFYLQTDPSYKFQSAYKIAKKKRDLANKCNKEATEYEKEGKDTLSARKRGLAQKYEKEAIDWLKTSLEFEVKYREPLIEVADIYFQRKDYHKTIFWLESAINLPEPVKPFMITVKQWYTWWPHDILAQCYFNIGEYKKCIEHSEALYEMSQGARTYALENIKLAKDKLKETYKRPDGEVKLNLGSGSKRVPGFINCDLFPQEGVDEVFSLDEIPYADHSVDEIQSEHALEHLPRPKAEAAIKEWARVLKKGGKLLLKIPDLEDCCRKFLENPNLQESWYMHTIYGVQDFRGEQMANRFVAFPNKVNYGQIHYTGFTESRLRRLLVESGFTVDRIWKYDGFDTPSLGAEAHIPDIPQDQLKRIAFINNSLIPKYLSYGDYWLDAFKATGHHVDEYRYESISELPTGYDLYFFIEKRYEPEDIPDEVHPRWLYTQEDPSEEILRHFDVIGTPNIGKAAEWSAKGLHVNVIPNSNHSMAAQMILKSLNYEPKKSEVDIIIPSYKNLDYLKLTIESVRKNTEDYKLIVVNSGDDKSVRNYLRSQEDIKLIDSEEKSCFSKSLNKGLRLSRNDVVLLNNDVIVGKNWLTQLKNSPFDITNPFSNCDAGWVHNLYPEVGGTKLVPNMFIGQVDTEALMNTESPYSEPIPRDWVAFYATYVKRAVIDKTGVLDETFLNGGEDFDYCRRAKAQGFTCGHVFSSFVFHFGGKTRKVNEEENYQQHHKEDDFNNTYMRYKSKKTVAIYCGPAWERWTVKNINTTGIGGSETCAALLAKEFVKHGYRSVIIGDCAGMEGDYDGVEYIDHSKYDQFRDSNYIDYFISSRNTHSLNHPIKCGKTYVWAHDIFIPGIARGTGLPNDHKVTKYVCLSPWHVDFFSNWHNIDRSRIYIQGNGLDLSRYDNASNVTKDPYKLIYSSSPDRGLIFLLRMFPKWKQEFPELSLHVFYGFYNWESAIKQRGNPREVAEMNEIKSLMEQDGIVYHDRVSQKRLAEEQMTSSLWVYPTLFTETYCITATENMLAGTIPVCTTVAALQTTVPDGCGIKVARPEDCLQPTFDLLRNSEKQEEYRIRGKEYVRNTCGWGQVGKNWIEMFEKT